MKSLGRLGCLAALTTLAAVVGPASASAAERWVNDNDPNGVSYAPPGTSCADPGYATIAAAVRASIDGDTVRVCDGTYGLAGTSW